MNTKKYIVTVEIFYSFDSSYGWHKIVVNASDKDDAELKAVERLKTSYGFSVSDVLSVEEVIK